MITGSPAVHRPVGDPLRSKQIDFPDTTGGPIRCWRIQADSFLFFLGILSGIGYGFDSLGDRIHSLFPPALAVNILGHVDIRVTQNAPHNLLPYAFAQYLAGAEAPKIPFIARIGRVRISAKTVCQRSRAK